jgi:hypothetical protein
VGCDEFIVPVGCHESCYQETGNRSTHQQELSNNQCAPLDKEHREARVMERRKWDAVRKAEREEFADFDDDVYD